MTRINSRIKRTCAAACLFWIAVACAPAGKGVLGYVVGRVHQAFWCAAIELAVLAPIHTITYLSERVRAPRIFERLSNFVIGPLWVEFACSSIAQWLQLLVVQGSSSPFPAGPPTALDLWGLHINGAMYQGIAFLCIIQIVYDMNALLRQLQEGVELLADDCLAKMQPLFDDSEYFMYAIFERLIYVYLAAQGLLIGFTVHMFTTMAMYLLRMAVGMWVTGFVNAFNTLPVWQFCIFTEWAIYILVIIIRHVLAVDNEALAEEQARLDRRTRQVLFVGYNAAVAEGEARLLRRLDEVVDALAGGDTPRQQRARLVRQLREILTEARQLRQLRQGRPPSQARRRRRRPALYDTTVDEVLNRAVGLSAGAVVQGIKLLVPRFSRYTMRNTRSLHPEFAALWSEEERAHFYADALAGGRASSALGAVLVKQGALRRADYEDLWRRAGLAMGFVLGGDEAAVGVSGGGMASGLVLVLGKIAGGLVCGLELALGFYVIVGGIVMIYPVTTRRARS